MAKKSVKQVWYKIVGPNGEAVNGGAGKYDVPKDGKPGKWMPKIDDPYACRRGYHLVPESGISYWGREGRLLCIAEGRGAFDTHGSSDGKVAFAEARIVKVLGIFPKNWCAYDYKSNSGLRKTGDKILSEIVDPTKYKRAEAARMAREKAAKAKLVAKKKVEAAKAKKERDALRKKWAPVRKLYQKQHHVGWWHFICAYATIKGIKLTTDQKHAIFHAF